MTSMHVFERFRRQYRFSTDCAILFSNKHNSFLSICACIQILKSMVLQKQNPCFHISVQYYNINRRHGNELYLLFCMHNCVPTCCAVHKKISLLYSEMCGMSYAIVGFIYELVALTLGLSFEVGCTLSPHLIQTRFKISF